MTMHSILCSCRLVLFINTELYIHYKFLMHKTCCDIGIYVYLNANATYTHIY